MDIQAMINEKTALWTDEQLLAYLTNNPDPIVKAVGIAVETRWSNDISELKDLNKKFR